jgi:hypothetical protein
MRTTVILGGLGHLTDRRLTESSFDRKYICPKKQTKNQYFTFITEKNQKFSTGVA